MKKTITVSIVDDEADVREHIAGYLAAAGNIRCVSAYASAEEALKHLPTDQPDVILMDINLGEMDGNSLKITNTFGQVVFNNVITQQTFDIDLSKLGGAGLYFLYVSDPNQTIKSVKKIVLQ